MIRVLLVDDHTAVRQALAVAFEREPDCQVVAQASTLDEAREALDRFDVAVVDLDLHNGDGLILIRELHQANPSGMVLVLTASTERKQFALAVEAGADGVLHKSVRLSDVISALRCLSTGEQIHTSTELIELFRLANQEREQEREAQEALSRLTSRERQVLDALADGLNDKEIAERLSISVETTRTHMVHILGKLHVESRLQALVFAVRHGAVRID